MRTFIAVDIPQEVRNKAAALIGELKKQPVKVKWVEEENLHITLKFLGEVAEERKEELISLVKETVKNQKAFKTSFAEVGAFPALNSARVIWIGTKEGAAELKNLANSLDDKLAKKKFAEKEKREFSTHITIGRVKERKNFAKLAAVIEEKKEEKFGQGIVDHITIMQSKLSPKGPTYTPIAQINLS